MPRRLVGVATLGAVLLLPITAARAEALACAPPDPARMVCAASLAPGGRVVSAQAESGAVALPPVRIEPAPWEGYRGAVLLLVQTSDSRPAEVEARLAAARRLARAAPPFQHIGLAVYGNALTVLAPIGSSAEDLAARHPAAQGRETNLFRASLDALHLLDLVPADRRTLVVIGNGQSDDAAFSLTDVARAFQAGGVAITTIGQGRSARLRGDGLDVLRRLAEETGGRFLAPLSNGTSPEAGLDALPGGFEGGARLTVDLTGATGPAVLLRVRTSAGATLEARETYAPSPPPPPPPSPSPALPPWGWAGLGLALVLGAGLVLIWGRHRRRPVAAWLEAVGRGQRYPVTGGAFRIGRAAGNELVLSDDTVSAHHAVIRRLRGGGYTITDLGSSNQVRRNGAVVAQAPLCHGDLVELGETRLRFLQDEATSFPVRRDL